MKNKVLIIGGSLDCGGVQKALLNLCNSLDSNLYDINLLLTDPHGEWISFLKKEVHILSTPKYFQWLSIPKKRVFRSIFLLLHRPVLLYYFILSMLKGILSSNMGMSRQYLLSKVVHKLPKFDGKYDIVLNFSGGYKEYVLNNIEAKRKITWVHSDYCVYKLNIEIDKNLFIGYDNIACVSNTCKKIFDTVFPQLSHKSVVIHNMIDYAGVVELAENKSGFKDHFDGYRILDVTRIDHNKGLDIAVSVMAKLKRNGIKIRWYILGDGPYKKELELLINNEGLKNDFILLGQTINPYPYIKQADLIVHCSHFEGRSVAIDEALVLQKFVIVTDYSTAKDQINHGINGTIVSFDEDSIYKEIKNAFTLKDNDAYKRGIFESGQLIKKQGTELYNIL